jgi:hypothetical protein
MEKAFTEDVINALDEIAYCYENKIKAGKQGASSVTELSEKLQPIRNNLCGELKKRFKYLNSYTPAYWNRGGYFKYAVWINAASVGNDKHIGRLQVCFFMQKGKLRTEYVAYKHTGDEKPYHIEKIAKFFADKNWRDSFLRIAAECPKFTLECGLNNGKIFREELQSLTEEDLDYIARNGIDVKEYFTINYDRPFKEILHYAVEDLAMLVTNDWNELLPLYHFLEGHEAPELNRDLPLSKNVSETLQKENDSRYSPEWSEPYSYHIEKVFQCRRLHSKIIDALKNEIERLGYEPKNDSQRDLFIEDENKDVKILFEAKTDSGTSSVYSAIGQLYFYSCEADPSPRKVFVAEDNIDISVEEKLNSLDIEVLKYNWNYREEAQFQNLENLLNDV